MIKEEMKTPFFNKTESINFVKVLIEKKKIAINTDAYTIRRMDDSFEINPNGLNNAKIALE